MMRDLLKPVAFGELEGWASTNHSTALKAFQRSAFEMQGTATGFRRAAAFGGTLDDWLVPCRAAAKATDARLFFESHFQPLHVVDPVRPEGLFTGYYEPLVQGSLTKDKAFPVPVYAKPADLVSFTAEETQATGLSYGRRNNGVPESYDTRQEIEQGSLNGKATPLCWLSDWVDAFFMHVQGQARVQLGNGQTMRLSYAGKAGHAYTGIGHVLIERGVAPPEKMSMQVLRDWMRDNPGEARALMWQNKSYIFFQEVALTDPSLGGIGAAKVNLTPEHSLAVDRAHWMFGTPLWIDTTLPPEAPNGAAPVHRLMIAQDTGSAIKGLVRGDFFCGWGDAAERVAGHMKSPGRMTAFLPKGLAEKLV
jgi:membrane-bound lytic murein transglycosylase A